MTICICKICNKEFEAKRKSAKCCSKLCQKISYSELRKCAFCGKDWMVLKNSNSKFCSNSCHTKSTAKPENKTIRKCANCGKEFQTWTHCKMSHKFCSQNCSKFVSNNKSKWYKINDIMCQGTWELAFVDWCIKNNIEVIFSRKKIHYINDLNKKRLYFPDYYIPVWNTYVDIKSLYTQKFSIRKFELLSQQHPEISIKVLNDNDLEKLGVDLSYKNRTNLEMLYSVDKSCTIKCNCDFCGKEFEKHYRSKKTSCSIECAHKRIIKKQCENFSLKKEYLKLMRKQFNFKFKSIIDAKFAIFLKENNINFNYKFFYKGINITSTKRYFYRSYTFNFLNGKKILFKTRMQRSQEFINLIETCPEIIIIDIENKPIKNIDDILNLIPNDLMKEIMTMKVN